MRGLVKKPETAITFHSEWGENGFGVRTRRGRGKACRWCWTRMVFDSMVSIIMGKGCFSGETNMWIHGFSVKDTAPLLIDLVGTRVVNTWTVHQALIDEQRTMDIGPCSSFMALLRIMHLLHDLTTMNRDTKVPKFLLRQPLPMESILLSPHISASAMVWLDYHLRATSSGAGSP